MKSPDRYRDGYGPLAPVFNWQNPVDGGWICTNCGYKIIDDNLEEYPAAK